MLVLDGDQVNRMVPLRRRMRASALDESSVATSR